MFVSHLNEMTHWHHLLARDGTENVRFCISILNREQKKKCQDACV